MNYNEQIPPLPTDPPCHPCPSCGEDVPEGFGCDCQDNQEEAENEFSSRNDE